MRSVSILAIAAAMRGGFDAMLTPNIFARLDYEYIQWTHVLGIRSHMMMGHLGLGYRF